MTTEEHIKLLKNEMISAFAMGVLSGAMISWAIGKWGTESATYPIVMGPLYICLFIKDLRKTINRLRKVLILEAKMSEIK